MNRPFIQEQHFLDAPVCLDWNVIMHDNRMFARHQICRSMRTALLRRTSVALRERPISVIESSLEGNQYLCLSPYTVVRYWMANAGRPYDLASGNCRQTQTSNSLCPLYFCSICVFTSMYYRFNLQFSNAFYFFSSHLLSPQTFIV